jgi:hypothetical protein
MSTSDALLEEMPASVVAAIKRVAMALKRC